MDVIELSIQKLSKNEIFSNTFKVLYFAKESNFEIKSVQHYVIADE